MKPVAWMWQHEETGVVGFLEDAPEEELRHWERMNKPRKIITPLVALPPGYAVVPVEPTEATLKAIVKAAWTWCEPYPPQYEGSVILDSGITQEECDQINGEMSNVAEGVYRAMLSLSDDKAG